MQKNHIFKRITSGLLALVMVIGLLPMGAVRVSAEDSGLNYVLIDSAAQGIYKQCFVDDIDTWKWDGPTVVLAFGDENNLQAVSCNAVTFSVMESTLTSKSLTKELVLLEGTPSDSKWQLTYNGGTDDNGLSYVQRFIYAYYWASDTDNGNKGLYSSDNSSLELVKENWTSWNMEDNSDKTAIKAYYINNSQYYTLGIVDGKLGLISGEAVDTSSSSDMFIYAPVTMVYAALDSADHSVEANSVTTDELLSEIKRETFVNISSDSTGTDAAAYDLNTSKVGNYEITTTWDTPLDTATAGTYEMTVKANGVELGTITVEVTAPATSYSVAVGTVEAMHVGSTTTALATVKNGDTQLSEGYTLAWSSDNTKVATVNPTTGKITAVAPGTATITAEATLTDGTEVSGTTQVTVNVPDVSISFADPPDTVTVGKTVALEPTVVIKAGDTVLENVGYTLIWESSSTGNATVSGGTVTGVAVGNANITAKVATITIGEVTVNLTQQPSATVAVTVEASTEPALTLDKTQVTLSVGGTDTVVAAAVNSEEAVTWSSDNTNVATVADGTITAVAPGTATVTATLGTTGVTVTVTVTVTAPVVLSITPEALTLGAGKDSSLTYGIKHNNADLDNPTATITWTSDNEAVATVDANGKITALAGGTATITATLTGLKDGDTEISLNDAGSYCVDTVEVTVIQAVITADDSIALTITESVAEPTSSFLPTASLIPSNQNYSSVSFSISSSTDTSVAMVSMDDSNQVTVTGHKVGTASFTVTATFTLSDSSTVSAEKTISVRVNSDALQQNQTPVPVGREESTYVYELLDAAGLKNAQGKNLVISFDKSGNQILIAADGKFVLTKSSITKQDDGTYVIQSGPQYSIWRKSDWGGLYFGNSYYITYDDVSLKTYISQWAGTVWTMDDATGGGVTLSYKGNALGLNDDNELSAGAATSLDSIIYFFSETEVEGAQLYAALYCKDYSVPVTEYSSDLLSRILAECYVKVGTSEDLSGETDDYYLNAFPEAEGYSYVITRPGQYGGTETVTDIDAAGVYTITVYGKNTSGSDVKLGSFTITIEAPQKIALTINTDGTLDANGNLSLGTGKTANITPVLTVTMADGRVVPATMLEGEVTVADEEWNRAVTIANGVVTGGIAGSESITASLGNSLKINGLEVLNSVSDKDTTETLYVNVYQINYVSLDTSEIPGAVTVDVEDEGKTSAEITLGYLKDPTTATLPDTASVSYECEISDPDNTGISAVIQDGKLIISTNNTSAKGTATVTVRMILNENPDSTEWETGTVTERQITVNVTHNAAEPYEITVSPGSVLTGIDHTKELQATVTQGTNVIEGAVVDWNSNNETVATVNEDGVVTGVAVGTATVTATVSYTLDGETESRTATCQVPVKVAEESDLYVLTVSPESINATLGTSITLSKQLTYEGDPCSDSVVWEFESASEAVATVDESGKITLVGRGSTTVTVTATITRSDGTTVTKTKTVSVNSTESVLTIGTDYSNAEGAEDEITVSAGTAVTLTPHVDVSDWLTSYTVSWEVVDANGAVVSSDVVSVTTPTLGGPLSDDVSDGIQSIGDAETTITVSASAAVGAEYTVRAWLTEINGIPVTGTKDEIKVNVVSAENKVTLQSSFITDILNQVNDPDDTGSNYEFRIKDAHTYLPDGNGLDARVIAVQGDNRIDFSNVTLNVYKDGQLVLDATTGKPIEIPASQLSFYNVETDEVGWQQVRVTWMDFYQTDIVVGENGKTATGYKYTEYTTGEDGQEGYIWMYVREPVYEVGSSTATINGETVVVSLSVSDIRPWLGAGQNNTVENMATDDPIGRDWRTDPERAVDLVAKFTYNGKEYTLKDGDDALKTQGKVYTWDTTGALVSIKDTNNQLEYRDEYYTMNYTAKSADAIGNLPALGYFTVTWKAIVVDGELVELDAPITVEVPVVVREDDVPIDNMISWKPHDAQSRWGSTQSYGFHYWLGGMPISAFAISYESDIGSSLYNVGIMDATANSSGNGGSWLQVLNVDAPLGTGDVLAMLHSVTRNDGTVVILDEGDRELDVSDAKYKLNVDPEMLLLEVAGANLGFETSSEVQATITDLDGNLITTDAVVKWTLRNSSIAKVDEQDISLTYPTAGDTQYDGYFSENVPSTQTGITDQYTMTSVKPGVTYITAQLISVGGENVESQMIADYCIIYVVDKDDELESVDIVIDYGKPIEIQYEKLTHTETVQNSDGTSTTYQYELAGFADTEHPMRKHAYTTYGEIEFFDGTEPSVIYTPLDIVDQVETVYCILQKVGTNNEWVFHKIHIIPATVVYYETDGNVSSAFDPKGSWATVGTHAAGVQDDYESDAVGGEEIYGFDSSYDNDLNLSNESSLFVYGTATAAEVLANDPSTNAKFTFQGTGFDLISRTGVEQATLRVHVYNSEGQRVKVVSVICKGTNELYQIPVISVKGLDYGTYDVEIIVYDAYDPRTALDQATQNLFGEEVLNRLARGNEFYFDAIRVYDPVKGNEIAEAAYATDGEYAQTIQQIGQLLVDQNKFQETADSAVAVGTGAVFMDSYNLSGTSEKDGFITATQVGTYEAVGPNNEVYLGQNQGIAFILDTKGTVPASIQIGAKSIQGDIVTLNAKLIKAASENGTMQYAATSYSLEKQISTGTAMYYELLKTADSDLFSSGNQVYVVIWNTGETVLSITDIKFAYKETSAQAVTFLYSAELASVAAATISEYEDQTYLKRIGEDWCYCDSNGEVIVYSGLVQTQDSGIWYVVEGKVDFSYSGLYQTTAGERYSVRSGRVETGLNGIAERDGKWLYFTAGRVDTSFTGIASYGDSGEWYVLDGEVQVSNSGTITLDGVTYNLENGKVISNS